MRRRLINQQSEPRFRETAKTLRLSVKARIMMALFALMLIPQGTWAQGAVTQYYDVCVNGTWVTSENESNVLSTDAENNNKVEFQKDASGCKLTLSGANFTGDIIYGEGIDLEIDITGTNIIGSIQNTSTGGTGALKITSVSGGSTANTLTVGSTTTPSPSVLPVVGFTSVTLDGIYISSNDPYYYDQSTKRYISTSYSGGASGDMTSMTFTTDCYPLWIGGTQVTSANKNAIGDASIKSGGTVVFDGVSKLTFNTVETKSGNNTPIISGLPSLTIHFSGANSLSAISYNNAIFTTDDNTNAALVMESDGGGATLALESAYGPIQGFTTLSCSSGTYLSSAEPMYYGKDAYNVYRLIDPNNDIHYFMDVAFISDVTYPLWIGDNQVTAANGGDVFGNSTSAFTATELGNTLSLNDLSVSDGNIVSGLDNLTIDLHGDNTVTLTSSDNAVIKSFNESAPLKFKTSGTASKSLQLNNPTTGSSSVISGFASVDYMTAGLSLTNTNQDVMAYNETQGALVDGNNTPVHEASLSFTSYNLTIAGTPVTSDNKDDVLTGSNAGKVVYTPHATVTNSGTLTLNGATIDGTIVSSLDNLTIEIKGANSLTGTSGYISYSNPKNPSATGTLTIKKGAEGSSLHLNNTTGPSAVGGFSSVTLDGTYLRANNSCEYVGGVTMAYQYHATDTYPVSNVQELEFTTQHYYPLWVGSAQVNEAELDDVLDDGTVSFTSASGTNTLTLNGASIDSSNGIESGLDNLTIVLKGSNSVSTNTAYNFYPIYSYVATAPLTIQKDGSATKCSLTLSSNNEVAQVVKGFASVTLSGLEFAGSGTTITDAATKGAILLSDMFSGGNGSSGTPFLISTTEDLETLSKCINLGAFTAHVFQLSNSINCSSLTWFDPIGKSTHPFKSTFQGNNNTISNLTVSSTDDAGLFGVIQNGSVYDLTLSDCTISGGTYAGAIVGKFDGATISRTKVTGNTTVTATTPGAIVGQWSSGLVTYSTYEYTVTTQVTGASSPTSGYTPRAIGKNGDSGAGGDNATQGTVLYTKTLSTPAITNGTINPWYPNNDTYPNSGEFAPGQKAYFWVTPATGYAITSATVTYTIAGDSQEINANLEPNYSGDGNYVYSFTMPDADDVTATATLAIDVSSSSAYTASIDNATYSPTASLTPTKVTLTPTNGSSAITLDSDKNEFTIKAKTLGGTAADFTKAGTYVVTIQGNGNYTGTTDVNYTIDPQNASNLTIATITNQTYTGSVITPALTVTDGTTPLTEGTDYSVVYASNINVGTATATITGTGNYTGTNNQTFKIVAKNASTLTIAAIADQTYTGSAITPALTVTDGAKPLTQGTDYSVVYASNINVGTATATITGTGNYSGTKNQTFKIVAKDASNLTIATIGDQTYTGSAITPALTVTDGAKPLTEGSDYTVAYTSNTNVGTATATITGTGNYASTNNQTFKIVPKSATGLTVTVSGTYTYTGSAIEPASTDISVSDSGTPLVEGTDYTISYNNNTDAGTTAEVIITGKGNYDSATNKTANFTIGQATITSVTLDQTLFTYAPGVTHYVTVTAYAGTIPVPAGSITVTVDGVATNGASTIGTHTVRATARTDIANNFKGYAENTFKIQERTINITFGSRTFRTFYDAGEPFLIPNNMTAYIVTGVSSNTVTLKKVSFVQAGIPVLLESTPGTTNVADPAETFTGNLLKYATATVTTNGSQYVLYSDEFVKATGTINGKVYLDLTGLPSPARAFTIRTENTTTIETVDNSELTDDNWYDMQGRKINKPTKTGIYIKNGKKVVVKTRY